jgi:hypothetical protein
MRAKDSGTDMLDEGGPDGERVGLMLACALAVGAAGITAVLRIPTGRGGSGGKSFSTVGLGVEVRGPS